MELDCIDCYAALTYQIMDFSLVLIGGTVVEIGANITGQAIVNGDMILNLELAYEYNKV